MLPLNCTNAFNNVFRIFLRICLVDDLCSSMTNSLWCDTPKLSFIFLSCAEISVNVSYCPHTRSWKSVQACQCTSNCFLSSVTMLLIHMISFWNTLFHSSDATSSSSYFPVYGLQLFTAISNIFIYWNQKRQKEQEREREKEWKYSVTLLISFALSSWFLHLVSTFTCRLANSQKVSRYDNESSHGNDRAQSSHHSFCCTQICMQWR